MVRGVCLHAGFRLFLSTARDTGLRFFTSCISVMVSRKWQLVSSHVESSCEPHTRTNVWQSTYQVRQWPCAAAGRGRHWRASRWCRRWIARYGGVGPVWQLSRPAPVLLSVSCQSSGEMWPLEISVARHRSMYSYVRAIVLCVLVCVTVCSLVL